jgi:hypothetical protein
MKWTTAETFTQRDCERESIREREREHAVMVRRQHNNLELYKYTVGFHLSTNISRQISILLI